MLRLIVEGSHVRHKTTNNCLNTLEQVEMVGRNKDDSLPSPAVFEMSTSAKENPQRKKQLSSSF